MLCHKSENGWKLDTIANKHLSCENYNLKSEHIDIIEQMLQSEFGNKMKKEHIVVSYDNWSGVFIMQMTGFNTDSSDDVIKEIYDFLSESNALIK